MTVLSLSFLANLIIRKGLVSVIAWLLLFGTAIHAGPHYASSRHDRQQMPKRGLSGSNNIFKAGTKIQKDVTIVYVNYTNFFDDDAYIKKVIALPPFRLTLEFANTYGASSSDMALDLNAVLYGYLSEKIGVTLPTISSLSLAVDPASTRRTMGEYTDYSSSSLRRQRLSSTITSASFVVSGNATFTGGDTAYLTEQVNNSTVSAMSDSTSVLSVIQTQGTNPGLKTSYGVSTSINGQSFSMANTIVAPPTSSGSPISLTLALGYGAIGLAGLGVLIAVFIVSRRSWKRKTFNQGHRNLYENQAKATYTDIRSSSRTKRVQFNQDANTIRTIASASPNNSLDLASPVGSPSNDAVNEDIVDLIPFEKGEMASWGHVDDIIEEEVKVHDAPCIIADLKSLPSPTTLTHQGFLDFLFGRPPTSTSPDTSPVRVIGDDDPTGKNTPRPQPNREVFVFETSKWFPPLPEAKPKPTITKKKVTPVSAIEGLVFVSKFEVDTRKNLEEESKPVHSNNFFMPQCGTDTCAHEQSPSRTRYESKYEFQNKAQEDTSKENFDLSSEYSSDSSSLGLDMVDFIRQTMDGNDPSVNQHLLTKHHEISDDELPFDCSKDHVKVPSCSAALSPPSSKGTRNLTKTHASKAEDVYRNRERIPLTTRSPGRRLGRSNEKGNSLLDSEADEETEYCSDEDNGALCYSKDTLKNQSPEVHSPQLYQNANGPADLGRLGADPVVNKSLLTLYDEEDAGMMDASHDAAVRSNGRTSEFVSEVKRYQRKQSRYDSILDLDKENQWDHETGVDRYFTKELTYSHTMKLSPKRKNEDGSFPKI